MIIRRDCELGIFEASYQGCSNHLRSPVQTPTSPEATVEDGRGLPRDGDQDVHALPPKPVAPCLSNFLVKEVETQGLEYMEVDDWAR